MNLLNSLNIGSTSFVKLAYVEYTVWPLVTRPVASFNRRRFAGVRRSRRSEKTGVEFAAFKVRRNLMVWWCNEIKNVDICYYKSSYSLNECIGLTNIWNSVQKPLKQSVLFVFLMKMHCYISNSSLYFISE